MSDSVRGWPLAYRREWLRPDVIAGLTAAAVVVPKAMAYAAIAGLPLEAGLYTALAPMCVYAFLGTSPPLSVSSTSTIAILVAAELALVVPNGGVVEVTAAAATLTMLTGAILLIAGFLRLGFLANFISDPVLTGFKAGIGVVIVVDQLPKLLGIHIEKSGLFRSLASIFNHLPEAGMPALILAAVSFVLIVGVEHRWPWAPAPLFAVAIGIVASGLLGFQQMGLATAGPIHAGLPVVTPPVRSMAWSLLPGAAGIALMAYIESIAAGRAFARKGESRPVPNRELVALGVANFAGSMTGAMPAGGGTSQTAVNRTAGARSQMAELVTVGIVLLLLLALSPVISLLPQVTLAAVVIATTLPLVTPAGFTLIGRIRRTELWWALAAFAGVIFLGTLDGILVAVAISVVTLFYQANHPAVHVIGRKPGTDVFRPRSPEHPEDESLPGLLIVRPEGRMTFASGPQVAEKLWALIHEVKPRVVLIDFGAIPDIEYTALRGLTEAEERLRSDGIMLWLAGLNPSALAVVRRSPLGEVLGRERMFFTVARAVEAYAAKPAP